MKGRLRTIERPRLVTKSASEEEEDAGDEREQRHHDAGHRERDQAREARDDQPHPKHQHAEIAIQSCCQRTTSDVDPSAYRANW